MDRKLYKIVVADDENTIRRGICNFIDWKRMGYQIVADFEDGKELLGYRNNETCSCGSKEDGMQHCDRIHRISDLEISVFLPSDPGIYGGSRISADL